MLLSAAPARSRNDARRVMRRWPCLRSVLTRRDIQLNAPPCKSPVAGWLPHDPKMETRQPAFRMLLTILWVQDAYNNAFRRETEAAANKGQTSSPRLE